MIATTARKASASLYDMSHIGCHHRKGFRGGSLLPSTQVVSAIPLPAIVAHARREMLPLQLGRDASDDARRRRRAGAIIPSLVPARKPSRSHGGIGRAAACSARQAPARPCSGTVCRMGLEGIVSKRTDAPYRRGSLGRGSSRRTRRTRRCAGRVRRNGVGPPTVIRCMNRQHRRCASKRSASRVTLPAHQAVCR